MACPECGSTSSTMYKNSTIQVCDGCTFVLWEDL